VRFVVRLAEPTNQAMKDAAGVSELFLPLLMMIKDPVKRAS